MVEKIPISDLSDPRLFKWCAEAKVGDEIEFYVSGEPTQEEATTLAGEINRSTSTGVHIWMLVHAERVIYSPDPCTPIHVRCSNPLLR